MFYELRQYHIRDGRRADWVRVMEEEIIPFQVSQGMNIVGSFTADDQEDLYVWLRRFEDEEDRKQLYARVYESDHWKNAIKPLVDPLIQRELISVTRLTPTGASVIR